MKPFRLPVAAALLAALSFAAGAAVRAPQAFEPRGFRFETDTTVPVPPNEAFAAFTGDVTGWWDHHFAPETPDRLYIETHPGGGFYEYFDEGSNGVQHARVTFVRRGELLVMRGPLGLFDRAFDAVYSVRFEAVETGTRVAVDVRGVGELGESDGAVVESVWKHFLESYTGYVERGEHGAKLGR